MNPVFCAIDTPDLIAAGQLTEAVRDAVGGIKLGLEFFMAHGAAGYRDIAARGLPIFLDLKLHDIPNTVAGAVASLLPLRPAFMTIHASGGAAMMRAAADAAKLNTAEAAATAGDARPKLLAVTVLTSLDAHDLAAVGQEADTARQVVRLAQLARDNGMDGVICSPEEVVVLRAAMPPDFILMVPGIRPAWAAANDQKRVMTPREACDAGANFLVIGRPITKAENPAAAARRIAGELA
ncbi:MAG: orotidine-5'-phosphate decarboxylase [Alphaproteobacteria bacterium]|nr:orotidine-5'-phosphate decarboxylase [Alphaproteobacteria bacterium]